MGPSLSPPAALSGATSEDRLANHFILDSQWRVIDLESGVRGDVVHLGRRVDLDGRGTVHSLDLEHLVGQRISRSMVSTAPLQTEEKVKGRNARRSRRGCQSRW